MEDPSEFLDARLAAAAAIPPEHRSPDVSAFLECYRLEQEVLTALKAPGYQWQVTDGLKLARADYVGLGGLLHYEQLRRAVALQAGRGATWGSSCSRCSALKHRFSPGPKW